MLAFLLQINEWLHSGHLFMFALFMLLIWLLWLLRVMLATQYRPYLSPYRPSTSVIVPVVDERPELFREVLQRIVEQHPTEVTVVINGPRNRDLEKVCADVGVRWCWTDVPGKRNALRIGVGMSTGEIAVLVDSDTLWTSRTLAELVKPFRDHRVGGVTTRQRILRPDRSVLTRWADWLESVRSEYSMPAMSVLGTVGCLPGRTIAFRRSILIECMGSFLTERFLGVVLEVSDDRALTNYTLKAGYRTVYQSTSLVYTDAPTRLGKLTRQQYRWARGSQYNTLRMTPWMLANAPVLAVLYLADIVIPFILLGSFASWGYAIATGDRARLYQSLPLPAEGLPATAMILGLTAVMTTISLSIRFARHFAYRSGDLLHMPAFMLINTFVLLPIRVVGFIRMAHNAGWGTRSTGSKRGWRWNPLVIVPYLLGGVMLAASVMVSV